jgi:hypothetical protein
MPFKGYLDCGIRKGRPTLRRTELLVCPSLRVLFITVGTMRHQGACSAQCSLSLYLRYFFACKVVDPVYHVGVLCGVVGGHECPVHACKRIIHAPTRQINTVRGRQRQRAYGSRVLCPANVLLCLPLLLTTTTAPYPPHLNSRSLDSEVLRRRVPRVIFFSSLHISSTREFQTSRRGDMGTTGLLLLSVVDRVVGDVMERVERVDTSLT